jgi:hypothetical protein
MTAANLDEYGLVPVATFHIADRALKIEIINHEITKLERCIYAFLVDDVIVRIGSSKAKLRSRLRRCERDVTEALNGRKSSTPEWEAELWNNVLSPNKVGLVFARQGTMVRTPVGTFPAYQDEESILLGKHQPKLNRNMHR